MAWVIGASSLVIALASALLLLWNQDGALDAALGDAAAKARLRAAANAVCQQGEPALGIPDESGYIYTKDWFTDHIPNWQTHLKPPLADQPIQVLEVGSYEGRSAVWIIQNLLVHPNSNLTCVDALDWTDRCGRQRVYARFEHNVLQRHPGKVSLIREWSSTSLKKLALSEGALGRYHLIYIDGDHQAKAVLEDAVLAYPLLKPGGYLVFDDYEWDDKGNWGREHPRYGIDAFLRVYGPGFDVVDQGYQVMLRKK